MSGVIDPFLALPWGYQGPVETSEDGETFWELTISEFPDFYLAGDSKEEVFAELLPALREFLSSYLEAGDAIPEPKQKGYWQFGTGPMRVVAGVGAAEETDGLQIVPAA